MLTWPNQSTNYSRSENHSPTKYRPTLERQYTHRSAVQKYKNFFLKVNLNRPTNLPRFPTIGCKQVYQIQNSKYVLPLDSFSRSLVVRPEAFVPFPEVFV